MNWIAAVSIFTIVVVPEHWLLCILNSVGSSTRVHCLVCAVVFVSLNNIFNNDRKFIANLCGALCWTLMTRNHPHLCFSLRACLAWTLILPQPSSWSQFVIRESSTTTTNTYCAHQYIFLSLLLFNSLGWPKQKEKCSYLLCFGCCSDIERCESTIASPLFTHYSLL